VRSVAFTLAHTGVWGELQIGDGGQTSDALDHLRHAIEMSAEFRDNARNDSDLDPIRDEAAFKQLVGD
jgi:hypothetical protein